MNEEILLSHKTKEELKQIATGLGIEKISALKKEDIIKRIIKARETAKKEAPEEVQPKKKERPSDVCEVCGVLDILNDGFGFLR